MSLTVQADGLAAVVRIVAEDHSHELDPERAEALGEELIRAARDVTTEQSTLGEPDPDAQQLDLQAAIEGESGGAFDHLMDREEQWELGATAEPDDPLEW